MRGDCLLIGQLHLLAASLNAKLVTQPLPELLREVFEEYLFKLPSDQDQGAICGTTGSRKQAFVVLRQLMEQSEQCAEMLTELVSVCA